MYSFKEIEEYLDTIAPTISAEPWDNVGLMIGTRENPISKVMLALDVTPDVIDQCIENDARFLITHHPIFFEPCLKIDFSESQGAMIKRIIENNITVYAMHSNLDKAEGGVNDALAKAIGFGACIRLDYLRIGRLLTKMPFFDLADRVRKMLDSNGLILSSPKNSMVQTVALACGSFDASVIPEMVARECDVLIAGEIKHHVLVDLEARGIRVIIAGHEATERVVLPMLQEKLTHAFSELSVCIATNFIASDSGQ
ncbi:MAG: Nif3-like dinuclear metal center hexameric protein [Clostridiaceae bacterium]|nr:Nif3-like dinuclear metal center hexameric protein [Clostridiaceae bacterium]